MLAINVFITMNQVYTSCPDKVDKKLKEWF